MPDVIFNIESDAHSWELTVDGASQTPLIISPNTTATELLAPGYYDYTFVIHGEVGKTGTLTIERPRYKLRIDKLKIVNGGIAASADRFRVVSEG